MAGAPHRPHVLTNLLASATLIEKGSLSLSFVYGYNPSAAAAFIQFFDASAAANVTVGTTLPLMVLAANTLSVINPALPEEGLRFGAGIVVAATTTATGSAAPSVGLVMNISCYG